VFAGAHLLLAPSLHSAGLQRSGAVLWAAVRAARESGALARVGRSQSYSLVANVFSSLFPEDYDRVSQCRDCCSRASAGHAARPWSEALEMVKLFCATPL
jgi:hypothetical protein